MESSREKPVAAQTVRFLVARGGPGLINFAALSIYTRLVSPGEYGIYALVLASLTFSYCVGFQWLGLGLLRFHGALEQRRTVLLSTVAAMFLALVAASALVGAVLLALVDDPALRRIMLFAIPALWAQGLFELNLILATLRGEAAQYGAMSLLRAAVSLAIGASLAFAGYGAAGLVAGLFGGFLAPVLWKTRASWSGMRWRERDPALIRELAAYGLPLVATSALEFVVNTSDRYLLRWFLGVAAVGVYAAGYDLSQQSLVMLMVAANLAAYPGIVRTFEDGEPGAARARLSRHASLLGALAIPAGVGLAVLAEPIAGLMVGEAFRPAVVKLVPWIVLASLLLGIKAFYFDLAFQLGRRTILQVVVNGLAAVLNIALTVILVPRYGIMGAAYATAASYAAALAASVMLGRGSVHMPMPWGSWLRTLLAAGAMAAWLLVFPRKSSVPLAIIAIVSGALVYGAAAAALNVCDTRVWMRLALARLARRVSPSAPA